MILPKISNSVELEALVTEIGFLPFFTCEIEGYSLKECTPAEYWFVDGVEGPWEWKGMAASKGNVAYGKLFNKKAGFVSKKWYPDLANYRRDGYDFDARYEDGLASYKCKKVMDLLTKRGSLLSNEIKESAGFGKKGLKGFDTVITTLQIQTYITAENFEYKIDKYGCEYGWGIARYAISEEIFGSDYTRSCYSSSPMVSKTKIMEQVRSICPKAFEKQIERLIR